MIIRHQNFRKGEVKVEVQNADDLWYLSSIIDLGDTVSGSTIRKIKLESGGDDRNAKVIKKRIFLIVRVDKIEFHRYTNALRVSGEVQGGAEDVSRGSHHTFNVEKGTVLTIKKARFLKFQIDKIKESAQNKKTNIMICSLERDQAMFVVLKKYGYEILSEISGDVQKKYVKENISKNFYKEVTSQLLDYKKKYEIDVIVIGSPAFWKDELNKELKKVEMGKVIFATCNSFGKNAVNEILKRPEIKEALNEERSAKEMHFVDELLAEIAKEGKASYGLFETENAANAGAIKVLLVTDDYLTQCREKGTFRRIEKIMNTVETTQGEVHIVSSEHDGGQKLDGLGGIGGILRYQFKS